MVHEEDQLSNEEEAKLDRKYQENVYQLKNRERLPRRGALMRVLSRIDWSRVTGSNSGPGHDDDL